jgi:hypothetical protein
VIMGGLPATTKEGQSALGQRRSSCPSDSIPAREDEGLEWSRRCADEVISVTMGCWKPTY